MHKSSTHADGQPFLTQQGAELLSAIFKQMLKLSMLFFSLY